MRIARTLLFSTILAAPVRVLASDLPATDAPEDIVVTGAANTATSSATGLPLTILQTPQSVTSVDQTRITDFALTNINDLLDQVPGINVERVETDRTQYDARGFDITSFQVDGIGLPLLSAGIQFGDLDTALWERVDVVRGANGMMTGVGNPSATVNYIRKRPTPTFRASLSGELGSWNEKRIEGDISGPLNAAGTLQGRLIVAHEDHDNYLDYNKVNRNVVGGLLSWDVTPHLKATLGYCRQQNDADGVLWGALPLSYADGTQIRAYPRSASTSAPWTYWNTRDQSAFGELVYGLDNGWSIKGVYTYRQIKERAKLLYAYGYPDAETGLGLEGSSGIYPSDYKQYMIDAYASGPLRLFGRDHQLVFGVSNGRQTGREYEAYSLDTITYPDFRELGHVTVAEPAYPDYALQTVTTDKITRVYGAAHLNLTDRLKGVAGITATWLKVTGISYDTDQYRKNSKVTPYVGALYDIVPNVTVYASYTGIFNPQTQVDSSNRRLAPATGTSIEGGIKSTWFGGKLLATAALFRAKQNNLATAVGAFGPDDPNGQVGAIYYSGVDTTSKGFEIELAGHVTDRWTLSGGYTGFTLSGGGVDGNPRPYIPNRTLKLSTTYAVPELRDLKLGAQLRWQDGIHYVDTNVQTADGADAIVRQKSYAVLDLMAGIRVVDRVRATVNVRNVTDKKYLGSLLWGQAYYAAPRSASVSLAFDY